MELTTLTLINIKLAFKKVDTNSFYSKVISKWTKSKYTHVEVIIEDKWISSDTDTGVRIRELLPLTDKYDYVDMTIPVLLENHNFIMELIINQDIKGYDYYGIIFAQFLPFRYESRDKWYCPELVTKILQMYNVKEVIDLYPQITSPGLLAKTFKLEV